MVAVKVKWDCWNKLHRRQKRLIIVTKVQFTVCVSASSRGQCLVVLGRKRPWNLQNKPPISVKHYNKERIKTKSYKISIVQSNNTLIIIYSKSILRLSIGTTWGLNGAIRLFKLTLNKPICYYGRKCRLNSKDKGARKSVPCVYHWVLF